MARFICLKCLRYQFTSLQRTHKHPFRRAEFCKGPMVRYFAGFDIEKWIEKEKPHA